MGETLYKVKIKATFKINLNVAFNMVAGTGLERIYVNFAGYNSHIKPDYSSFFVRIFPKIGKKNTLEKSKVWSKVWSDYRMASRLCVSASMTLNRRYS